MNYFTQPPAVARLPKFIYKWYAPRIFDSLMKWADAEWKRAIQHAIDRGDVKMYRALMREWSGMRILSQMDGFRYICAQLDERSWNALPRKTRKFIRKSYELYELLRKNA